MNFRKNAVELANLLLDGKANLQKRHAVGVEVEGEHTDDPKKKSKIAREHEKENPKYYPASPKPKGKKEALRWVRENDEDGEPYGQVCPYCGGESYQLGTLGRVIHWRCRNCGGDFNDSSSVGESELYFCKQCHPQPEGRYKQLSDLGWSRGGWGADCEWTNPPGTYYVRDRVIDDMPEDEWASILDKTNAERPSTPPKAEIMPGGSLGGVGGDTTTIGVHAGGA